MGWWGYDLYQGDEPYDIVATLLKSAGFKKNVPLLNGGSLDEIYDWNPESRTKLADSVVKQVYNNWDNVSKKLFTKVKNNQLNESLALEYVVAADFFITHGTKLPIGLKDNALASVQYLLGEHADDFDSPIKRRNVLNKFKDKLDNFIPSVDFDLQDTQKIVEEFNLRGQQNVTKNFEKAVQWLFDDKNKYLVMSAFEVVLSTPVHTFEEFKKEVKGIDFFDSSSYMKLPTSISSKLNEHELIFLQEIAITKLIEHYSHHINDFINVYNRINHAQEELQKASQELETFVSPPKKLKR